MVSNMKVHLLNDESIILKCKPRALAFFTNYAIAMYPTIAGLLSYLVLDYVRPILIKLAIFLGISSLLYIGRWMSYLILLWLLMMIPGVIMGVFKITWKVPIIYMIICLIVTSYAYYINPDVKGILSLLCIISIVGLIVSDIQRRGYEYYLTNYRIITTKAFLTTEERSIFYSRIVDVILKKGIIGKIFNYGTVIPITPSELGMGSNFAFTSAGIQKSGLEASVGGGKSIKVTRARAQYVLYGIPNPEKVYNIILEHIKRTEESEYLRKITEAVKNIERRLGDST